MVIYSVSMLEPASPIQLVVHLSPQDSLTLEPDQMLRLPLSLVPGGGFTARVNSRLSIIGRMHVQHWLGAAAAEKLRTRYASNAHEPWHRLNDAFLGRVLSSSPPRACVLPDATTIAATVVLDTSHGSYQHTVTAVVQPQNAYGVPSSIVFGASPSVPASGHYRWYERRLASRGETYENDDLPYPYRQLNSTTHVDADDWTVEEDCFDLYIRNPHADECDDEDDDDLCGDGLLILETMVSDPDHVSLRRRGHDGSYQRIHESLVSPAAWVIPGDGARHYVVTVCAHAPSTQVQRDRAAQAVLEELRPVIEPSRSSASLGFLQVRTEDDVLVVYLERADAVGLAQSWDTELPDEAFLSIAVDDDGDVQERNECFVDKDYDYDLWYYYPHEIHVNMVSPSVPTVYVHVELYNALSEQPITVMRMSAVLEPVATGLVERTGLEIALPGGGLSEAFPFEFNETVNNAFFFECTVDWNKFSKETQLEKAEFRGSVILRATSGKWDDYEAWEAALRADPSMDLDLVIEIPFTILLAKGKVGLSLIESTHPMPAFWSMSRWSDEIQSVEAAFFPLSQADARATLGNQAASDVLSLSRMNHQLRVFSNVEAAITLKDAAVVSEADPDSEPSWSPLKDLCKRFGVSWYPSSTEHVAGLSNETELGRVDIIYEFANLDDWSLPDGAPVTCYLKVTTEPDTGAHFLPLIVYSGQLDASGNRFRSDDDLRATGSADDGPRAWHRTIGGFEMLLSWLQDSKSGDALRSVVGSSKETHWTSEKDFLRKYLSSLSTSKDSVRLHPILLEAGAISQGETEVLPLYLTNHNPVPIKVKIDVGEVEGLSIALARERSSARGDGASLLDYLPQRENPKARDLSGADDALVGSGRFAGQPNDGLRKFLLTDAFPLSLLTQLRYREDVSLSDAAVVRYPLLKDLYKKFATATFHKTAAPWRLTPESTSDCDSIEHPAAYGSFASSSSAAGKRLVGPVIVSYDGKAFRKLRVCWSNDGRQEPEGDLVSVPPGGVARFDLKLRAPPSTVLEHDITQFLATGLVISTNYGQVMPLFVSFDALRGRLDVVDSRMEALATPNRIVQVPAGLFMPPSNERASVKLAVPPTASLGHSVHPRDELSGSRGVHLYMWSSFSREVQLREVLSCNPWFQVDLDQSDQPTLDGTLGVKIGTVKSRVSCVDPSNSTGYPSFFHCALNWMIRKAELQPRGCGLSSAKGNRAVDIDASRGAERGVLERAIRSFKRAIIVAEYAFGDVRDDGRVFHASAGKTGSRSADGLVAWPMLDAIADAWDAWSAVSQLGLNSVSTSLRAIVEYDSSDGEKNQRHVLPVSLRNVTIESVLETPRLFDQQKDPRGSTVGQETSAAVVEFPSTPISSVSSVMLPLRNPTAVPIKVRLAVAPEMAKEMDSASRSLHYALGVDRAVRERFLGVLSSPFVQVGRRDTTFDVASSDWWDDSSAFFVTTRDGDLLRSHHNITVVAGANAQVSLNNPSLFGSTAFVVGCGTRCALRSEGIDELNSYSAIGASAAVGATLSGQMRSKNANANQNQPGHSEHRIEAGGSLRTARMGPAAFAMPFSALDEVIIPPFGEIEVGPILFRPAGRFKSLGCQSLRETGVQGACESDVFESLLFIENSFSGLERVVLRGTGLVERIDFVDSAEVGESSNFSSIELRDGNPSLVFSGTSDGVLKEFMLFNSGDSIVRFQSVSLRPSSKSPRPTQCRCGYGSFRVLNCDDLNKGFSLAPGENQTVAVVHLPKCDKRKEFVSLDFEIDRRSDRIRAQDATDPANKRLSKAGDSRHQRANTINASFRRAHLSIMVGYDMTNEELASCTPVQRRFTVRPIDKTFLGRVASLLVMLVAVVTASIRGEQTRVKNANRFRAVFRSASGKANGRSASGANWISAFRCLDRADPSSTDLQTLGREQVRHIVLARYRSVGILQPQCINTAGAFHRERQSAPTRAGGRPISGGKNGSTERGRTLSDTTFRKFRASRDAKMGCLPCELGWRTAVAKGIVKCDSLSKFGFPSKTESLLQSRTLQADGDEATHEGSPDLDEESRASADEETFHDSGNTNYSEESSYSKTADVRPSDEVRRQTLSDTSAVSTVKSESNGAPQPLAKKVAKEPRIPNAPATEAAPTEVAKSSALVKERSEAPKATIGSSKAMGQDTRGVRSKTARRKSNVKVDEAKRSAQPRDKKKVDASSATPDDVCIVKLDKQPRDERQKNASQLDLRTKSGAVNATPTKKAIGQPVGTPDAMCRTPVATPLRPPPGLAPPPGFGSAPTPASVDRDSTPAWPPASLFLGTPAHDGSLIGSPATVGHQVSPNGHHPGVTAPQSSLVDIPLGTFAPPSPPQPHRDSTDFDIMDFLDGVLNDGHDDGNGPIEGTALPIVPTLSSNPWATASLSTQDAGQSRLSAYGIPMEDGSERADADSLQHLPTLLNPSAILPAKDDEAGKKGLFYTKLLEDN